MWVAPCSQQGTGTTCTGRGCAIHPVLATVSAGTVSAGTHPDQRELADEVGQVSEAVPQLRVGHLATSGARVEVAHEHKQRGGEAGVLEAAEDLQRWAEHVVAVLRVAHVVVIDGA